MTAHAFHPPYFLQLDQMTIDQDFSSMNLTEAVIYVSVNMDHSVIIQLMHLLFLEKTELDLTRVSARKPLSSMFLCILLLT